MRNIIIEKLNEIERDKGVRIIHAVESGSRAWGFTSLDSDYDVRFIYVKDRDFYLSLKKERDVIEYPIDSLLDINGWDLDKTLKLLHSSNPTLFEWSNSPIIYKTSDFFLKIKAIINDYFRKKSGLYHYISMAEGNYNDYLRSDTVRLKKYFYVLRPILACKYILKHNCPPPMLFSELMEDCLEEHLKPATYDLLKRKMMLAEVGEIAKIDYLNTFIENNLTDLKAKIISLSNDKSNDWSRLNDLFLEGINLTS